MECGDKSQHQRSQNNEGHGKGQQPVHDIEAGPGIGHANTQLSQTIILKGILQKIKLFNGNV